MAEWLGNGLQNRPQQFDSAWHLFKPLSAMLRGVLLYTFMASSIQSILMVGYMYIAIGEALKGEPDYR